MTGLFDSYVRWRHTRGFGVHSTFGYLLITDALYLRRPYSYYAESLPALEDGEGSPSGLARRLYRAAIFLRRQAGVDRIGVIGSLPAACRAALLLSGLRIAAPAPAAPNSDPASDPAYDPASAPAASVAPLPILYFDTPAPADSVPGLQLDARRWTLRIPRPQMAYTRYTLP